MKELELINLYYRLCEYYDKELWCYCQRFSNNSAPINLKLTDQELLTIYFYCRLHEGKQGKKSIHDFAERYMASWFPNLIAYANFNNRLNFLQGAITAFVPLLLVDVQEHIANKEEQVLDTSTYLIDSFPIMLCSGKRQGKVARDISDKTFCASKGVWYYGVKLHVVSNPLLGHLPIPEFIGLTPASANDLSSVKPIFELTYQKTCFVDKAYCSQKLQEDLLENQQTSLLTPIKQKKGEHINMKQRHASADALYSRFVSSNRQPIESFFSWIIRKTDLQRASTVRSSDALMLHTFGAIACCLFILLF